MQTMLGELIARPFDADFLQCDMKHDCIWPRRSLTNGQEEKKKTEEAEEQEFLSKIMKIS